jgi:hypothetical protein
MEARRTVFVDVDYRMDSSRGVVGMYKSDPIYHDHYGPVNRNENLSMSQTLPTSTSQKLVLRFCNLQTLKLCYKLR